MVIARCVVGLVATAVGLAAGCNRSQDTTVEPTATHTAPLSDADFDDLFEGDTTVRDHSPSAATYVALSDGCPYAPEEVPQLASLSRSIPEFDRSRSRASNMHRGEQRLQDIDLHAHMMGMQGQIFECVDVAACYDDGQQLSGDGDLSFDFELLPSGKVAAVSVEASPGLDHPSVVACARQAMYEYRFPKYEGAQMMVEYVMTIEEVDDDA